MDHEQIDQLDLIDGYVMGKLPAEERARFEEHFITCRRCIARLQTAQDFLQGYRLLAAERAARVEPRLAGAGWRFLFAALSGRRAALATGCLLIAALLSAALVIYYTRSLRAVATHAQRLAEQWEGRYKDEWRRATAAEQQLQEANSQQAEQERALAAKLKEEEMQRAVLAAEVSRRLPAGGNLPVFVLAPLRGREPPAAEGANQVAVPRGAALFALSVGLEGERRYDGYRGTVYNDHYRPVWSGRLTPGQHDSLSAWLNPSVFRPGHYSLLVEGISKAGGAESVGNYPFLFVKTS
jgi:hypothetical protein